MVSLLLAGSAQATAESEAVLGNYGPLEWIGGINSEVTDNSSEWLESYEGQPATEVDLSEPHSATADLAGNVYVADKNSHAIRVIGLDGRIRRVAGTNVAGFNGDGVATQCQVNGPQNAYPMPDGSFYVLDTGNRRIRKVDAAGQMITVIAETAGLSRGLWVARDESVIYYCTNNALKRWMPSMGTSPGTVMADGFSDPGNIDVAQNGDVYITDRGADEADPTFSQVYRVIPAATPSTFTPVKVAGTGGTTDSGPSASGSPALQAGLRGVRGIAFHPAGGYFLATHKGGDVWYVDKEGIIEIVVQGNDGRAHTATPVELPAAGSAFIAEPRFISVAPNGDLLMATNDAGFIRRARWLGAAPAAPVLEVAAPASAAAGVQLSWNVPATSWYVLESTDGSGPPGWIPRQYGKGTGAVQSWTDSTPVSGAPRQFYRLHQLRDWPN